MTMLVCTGVSGCLCVRCFCFALCEVLLLCFVLQLSPDILKCIKKAMEAPSNVSDMDAVAPLLNYLAENLQTLGDYTYSEVFSR